MDNDTQHANPNGDSPDGCSHRDRAILPFASAEDREREASYDALESALAICYREQAERPAGQGADGARAAFGAAADNLKDCLATLADERARALAGAGAGR